MGRLGLKPKAKRVGERSKNKRVQWYSASYNDLYTTFREKNMIDEAENINEPEGYQPMENTDLSLTSPEVFPAEEGSLDSTSPTNSTDSTSNSESPAECSKSSIPVPKKTPPKVPPKPEHLKIKSEESSVSDDEGYESNDEVYESDGAYSDDEVKKPESTPEESNESKQLPAVDDPASQVSDEDYDELLDTENDENSQNDEAESQVSDSSIPEPIVYKIDTYEKIFDNTKMAWKVCGYDVDDFDWECFITEIDEHIANKERIANEDRSLDPVDRYIKRPRRNLDPWYQHISEVANKCRNYLMDKNKRQVTDSEIIKDLNTYGDKRLIAYVPIPEDYASSYIVPSRPPRSQSSVCEDSKEDEDFSDDDNDDEWYDGLTKMVNKKK